MKKSGVKKSKGIKKFKGIKINIVLLSILILSVPLFVFIQKNGFYNNRAKGSSFQPTAPYYATFFYPWYQNSNTDGTWGNWNDLGHNPPQNWFSEYLPDPFPNTFDPVTELYSSKNDQIIYWQLRKLAEAKQEVAISSWWGQGHKTDTAFSHIIKDVMNRADNPYPNLRWAIYYEKEGFGNPSLTELVNDLNYVKNNYTTQPGYFFINGKPVVFVYNAAHVGGDPLEDLSRWKQVRAQTGFYVVMKVDPLNRGANPADMDGWHEYAPAAAHFAQKLPYYSFVSPGFWLNGSAERLTRDAAAFESGVQQMVASNATWKLTQTWNEWGEGSGVEPAEQVLQTTSGQATIKSGGYPFKNLYVDILSRNLPALESGGQQPTSKPVQNGNDPVLVGAGDISICGQPGAQRTAALIEAFPQATIFTLGDNSNESGTAAQYADCFGPTWGRFLNRMRATSGNHDYSSPGAVHFYNYFGSAAGPTGKGYYSYDLGSWHIIVLNTQCSEMGGCGATSPQGQWLQQDIAANKNKCTLAMWHIPLFASAGQLGNNSLPFWRILYQNNADIILNGHSHIYERFSKQDATGNADPEKGIRQFIVGTGGAAYNNLTTIKPNSEVHQGQIFGILKLTLHPNSYDWQFIPEAGKTFTDSGSANCNAKAGNSSPAPTGIVPTLYCLGVPCESTPNPATSVSSPTTFVLTPTTLPTNPSNNNNTGSKNNLIYLLLQLIQIIFAFLLGLFR